MRAGAVFIHRSSYTFIITDWPAKSKLRLLIEFIINTKIGPKQIKRPH